MKGKDKIKKIAHEILKSKKKMQRKIDKLKEELIELSLTNDFLIKEKNFYKMKYFDEHKKLLELRKELKK